MKINNVSDAGCTVQSRQVVAALSPAKSGFSVSAEDRVILDSDNILNKPMSCLGLFILRVLNTYLLEFHSELNAVIRSEKFVDMHRLNAHGALPYLDELYVVLKNPKAGDGLLDALRFSVVFLIEAVTGQSQLMCSVAAPADFSTAKRAYLESEIEGFRRKFGRQKIVESFFVSLNEESSMIVEGQYKSYEHPVQTNKMSGQAAIDGYKKTKNEIYLIVVGEEGANKSTTFKVNDARLFLLAAQATKKECDVEFEAWSKTDANGVATLSLENLTLLKSRLNENFELVS